MSYLTEDDIFEIHNCVRLLSIKEIENISRYLFDSKIKEYNDFLFVANRFWDINISKTFLLFHRETDELLAYMTLSADSIKLTAEEKEKHDIGKVPYASVPALKIGKLAVNRQVSDRAKRKGYGSFMLEMAQSFAADVNNLGVACRFLTVDADIEYDSNTPIFYEKNGFIENSSNKSRNLKHTVSMRRDIYAVA